MRISAVGFMMFTLAAAAAGFAGASPPDAVQGSPRPLGIWKAAVPAHPMSGEFEGFDPIGVAAGVKIKADCSLNWIDPDDGARYCFSSGTSLEFFLEQPHFNIARARVAWRKLLDAE